MPPEWILCGSGAAELIYAYCTSLGRVAAVELAPTFSEYALGLHQAGSTLVRYPLKQENAFRLDRGFLDFLQRQQPQAVFLCNPNNPTGQVIDRELLDAILALCKKQGIRLFLDECFADLSDGQQTMKDRLADSPNLLLLKAFTKSYGMAGQKQGIRLFLDECFADLSDGQQTMKDRLADSPNLLLLKAFTKSYGMAGLRLGYCLCSDAALLGKMAASVQPWNVSTPAQAAGKAALSETAFLERTRALIAQERPWLCRQLESLGLWVCPSQANYLLFQGPENLGQQAFLERTRALIAQERPWLCRQLESLGLWVCPSQANYLLFQGPENLGQQLRQEGIALRSCDNYLGLGPGWYRTAVRCRRENQQLVRAVAQALGRT